MEFFTEELTLIELQSIRGRREYLEGVANMSKAADFPVESNCSKYAVTEGVTRRGPFFQFFRLSSFVSKIILPIFCFLLVPAAGAASWTIPSVNGPLTIDGLAKEDIWKQATVLPMQVTDYGAGFPQGGEMRALVRGRYLCLSARLPETGRVVARSTGENPDFWRED